MIKPHHPVCVFLVSHSFLHGNQLSTFCSYNHTHTYHLYTKSLFFSLFFIPFGFSSTPLILFIHCVLNVVFISSCTSTHILQPLHWQHMHRIIRRLCHIVQWPASAQGQPRVSGCSVPRCPQLAIKTNNTCPVWHACTALSILIQ